MDWHLKGLGRKQVWIWSGMDKDSYVKSTDNLPFSLMQVQNCLIQHETAPVERNGVYIHTYIYTMVAKTLSCERAPPAKSTAWLQNGRWKRGLPPLWTCHGDWHYSVLKADVPQSHLCEQASIS